MRYWLFSVVLILFVITTTRAQDAKKGKDPEPEPVVNEIAGKSFEQWRSEIKAKDPSKSEVAIKTILNFGLERSYLVVPDILDVLEKHKSKTPLDLSIRVNGTLALSTIFKYHKNPDKKYLTRAAAVFKTSINDSQAILTIRTMQALPYLGTDARTALPDVLKHISDSTTWEVRQTAIQTVAVLAFDPNNPPAPTTIAKLAAAAPDGPCFDISAVVRHAAVQSLGVLGQHAKPLDKQKAVMTLNAVIKGEKDYTVIIEAHLAIIYITGNVSKKHVEPIAELFSRSEPIILTHALQAVGRLGYYPETIATIPRIIPLLQHPDNNIVLTAINTLTELVAMDAIPELNKIKNNPKANAVLKEAAESAIAEIQYTKKVHDEQKAKEKDKGKGK